jgi:hypothetical protein
MYHAKFNQYLPALFLLIICAGLFSCSKNCGCGPPQFSKGLSGNLKKTTTLLWSDLNMKDTIKNDTVTIWSTKTNYSYTVKLKFGLDNSTSKLVNGYYQKKIDAIFYQYGYGPGSVLVYKLDSTVNNTLHTYTETGAYDYNKGQWVVGHFNLTFKLATPTGNMAFDTTRVYFPGSFAVKLDK